MATVIVQSGTLRVGDSVVAGAAWGRVKALIDDKRRQRQGGVAVDCRSRSSASTSCPAPATSSGSPTRPRRPATSPSSASSATGPPTNGARRRRPAPGAKLEDIFEQIQRGETATLNLVLKADTQGSLEAVTESLRKLERDEVKLSFIHRAVGGITENDVTFAAASNATIIGFNVRPDRGRRELADVHDVEIRTYEIIYKLIEDIESAMVGMLAPEFEEVITGEAEVREIFRVPRVGRHRRLLRPPRRHHPRLEGPLPPRRRHHLEGRHHLAQAVQGRRPRGRTRASSAASASPTTRTSATGDVIETFDEREIPRT